MYKKLVVVYLAMLAVGFFAFSDYSFSGSQHVVEGSFSLISVVLGVALFLVALRQHVMLKSSSTRNEKSLADGFRLTQESSITQW